MANKHLSASLPDATATALSRAERTGFKIAVIGRTAAVMMIAVAYLLSFYFPINIAIFAITGTIAVAGLTPLAAIGTRFEKPARFALFAFDASAVTILLAFVPLSSGGNIPQNLVFLTSSVQHYYLVVAAAILTLSPPLVLWTGAWAAGGLLFATWWIMSGMEHIVSYNDLPISPPRDVYIQTVLNPNFLGIASRVQEALIVSLVTAIAALAVYQARKVVRDQAQAEVSARRVQTLFGRYVPAPVLRELIDEGHLAPQTRLATLMFADIEGFTSLSQGMKPAKLVQILNEFFTAITDIVDGNGGVVINYIGDAVLISFNAPLPIDGHADRALKASQEILTMSESRVFDGRTIRVRIGVATGFISAGTVGTGERQTYTVYGDAVNLAQRLQELNKEMRTNCLICGTTVTNAREHQPLTRLGEVKIRNLSGLIEVFAPTAAPSPATVARLNGASTSGDHV
ncbi:adenylate/guanylate cyclase domain-containing protein [Rhizobium ecuadorense]|uniref:adenylate/guanylate cyclase domain-containing protein n=1 Tax=Rhizobium ecuadorense TaxID=1671795 RepID=UPI000673794D|nr:adenylate/guanylate cyclase domain-containing protein [Rhizobium ecuadorense]